MNESRQSDVICCLRASRPRCAVGASARVDPGSAILRSLVRRRASGVRGAPRSSRCSIPRRGRCRGGCTRSGIRALRAIWISSGRLIALRRTNRAGSTAPAIWCGASRASRPTTRRRSSPTYRGTIRDGRLDGRGTYLDRYRSVLRGRMAERAGAGRRHAQASEAAMNMSASSGPARPTAPVAMSM